MYSIKNMYNLKVVFEFIYNFILIILFEAKFPKKIVSENKRKDGKVLLNNYLHKTLYIYILRL